MRARIRRAAVGVLLVSALPAATSGLPSAAAGSSQVELAVTITGNGFGTVADDSSPPSTCGTTSVQPCLFSYASPFLTPTVTATAAPGSSFAGWGGIGATCGTSTTCTIVFPRNTNQTQFQLQAVFVRVVAPAPRHHRVHRHHHSCTNDPGVDASNDPSCPRRHFRPSAPARG